MAGRRTSPAIPDGNRCAGGKREVIRGNWSPANGGGPIPWGALLAAEPVRARADRAMRKTPLKGLRSFRGTLGGRSVFVVGLGAVTGRASVEITRSGIGVECADPDRYGPESFLTQPTSERAAYARQRKAWRQLAQVHAANPAAPVRSTAASVQDVPLRLLHDADLWLAGVDNAETMVWLGQRAAELGKVLLQGAVHPESGAAIVRAWDLRDPGAACPACGMGTRQWAAMHDPGGCDPHSAVRAGTTPTRTLPPICGMAGQLVAFEVLKRLSGNDELALASEELTYSLWSHRALRTQLARNPSCRLPHESWIVTEAPRSWDDLSPAMLLAHYGARRDDTQPTMRGEITWISFALCQNCDRQHPVCRFGHPGARVGRCDCGGALVVPPAGVRSIIPPADLAKCRHQSLAELRLPPDRGIGLVVSERCHYFLPPRTIFDLPTRQPATTDGQEARP